MAGEARKRAVYEWVDENRPDLWDRALAPDDPELTPELLSTLARIATAAEPTMAKVQPSSVRVWLTNPQMHSPFVDEQAIERALDFDWPVFDALTRAERNELGRRLAAHPDPFGEEHPMDWVFDTYKIGAPRVGAPTPRYLRYMEGTQEQREAIRHLHRKALREAKAPGLAAAA